jgi:hypothetical protein
LEITDSKTASSLLAQIFFFVISTTRPLAEVFRNGAVCKILPSSLIFRQQIKPEITERAPVAPEPVFIAQSARSFSAFSPFSGAFAAGQSANLQPKFSFSFLSETKISACAVSLRFKRF